MMKANSLGFAAFGFEFVAQGEVALLEVEQGTDTRGVVTSDTTTFAEMLTKGPTSVVAYEKLRFSYE